MRADDLFKAYPKLRAVNVEFVNRDATDGGSYSNETNTIYVNENSSLPHEEVLAHEIQHAIQHIEGFARGGNTNTTALKETPEYKAWEDLVSNLREESPEEKELNETISRYADRYNTIFDFIENASNQGLKDKETANLIDRQKAYLEELETEIDNMTDKLEALGHKRGEKVQLALDSVNSVLYNLYNRLAGEVEARNVQKRMGLTEDQRRNSLAAETEDVSRDDQIFCSATVAKATWEAAQTSAWLRLALTLRARA